jgi:hypothetical protein
MWSLGLFAIDSHIHALRDRRMRRAMHMTYCEDKILRLSSRSSDRRVAIWPFKCGIEQISRLPCAPKQDNCFEIETFWAGYSRRKRAFSPLSAIVFVEGNH